ncbi:hypothetical protein D3C85_1578380 [compost metagenome]
MAPLNFSRSTSELAANESFKLCFVSSKPSLSLARVFDPLSGANKIPIAAPIAAPAITAAIAFDLFDMIVLF